jgi:hypothetical protein
MAFDTIGLPDEAPILDLGLRQAARPCRLPAQGRAVTPDWMGYRGYDEIWYG